MALTDVAIRNAKPRAKPYKMGDAVGLFVLIQPSGGKLWRFRAAYHRGAHWKERVAMAHWWSDHLDRLRKGAEIVPIKAGKR